MDEIMIKEHLNYWEERKKLWESKRTGKYKTFAIFDMMRAL